MKKPLGLFKMNLNIKSRILLGSFFGLLGYNEVKEYYRSIKDTNLMKERLKLPIYELSEEELINPPWTNDLESWKY